MSLDRYLTTLLSALTRKAGGKLSISVSDILKVEDAVLLRYPSPDLKDIVLQLAPRSTDMYITQEAPSWPATVSPPRQVAIPNQPLKTVRAVEPPPSPPRTASTLDNLSLYLKEQERAELLEKAQQQDELEERRRAGLSPFRTIPGK